jgi:putative endonuclease
MEEFLVVPSGHARAPADRRRHGEAMERAAWGWLERRHPRPRRLLARNWRWRGGELDLVFEERREDGRVTLVFAEVRTRRHARLGAAETLTGAKVRRLRTSATRYLARYAGRAHDARFDLLGWDAGAGWRWWPGFVSGE